MLECHVFLHNYEYLSGSMTIRGRPDIRVGYRLDVMERNESYYVESVAHTWAIGTPMTTTLTLTRGQPTIGGTTLVYNAPPTLVFTPLSDPFLPVNSRFERAVNPFTVASNSFDATKTSATERNRQIVRKTTIP